jgi:archaellum biogenesis protein FlaJ (TadC family)
MKMIFNSHNGRREDHHQRKYPPSLESKKKNNKTWLHCMLTFSFILCTMIVVVLQVGKNDQSHLFLMICLKVLYCLVVFSIAKIITPFTGSSCIWRQQIESIYSWMWKVNESAY